MPAELNHSLQQLVADLTGQLAGRLAHSSGRHLRVWVGGNDSRAKQTLLAALGNTTKPPSGSIDAAFVAAASADEAAYFAYKLKPRLVPSGLLLLILCQSNLEPDSDPKPGSESAGGDFAGDLAGGSSTLIDDLATHGFAAEARQRLPESYRAFSFIV